LKIGVLALQGDFREHIAILEKLHVDAVEVRTKDELDSIDGLIIPGGESTTMMKLLVKYGLDQEIIRRNKEGMAIFGTCAGAIVLAKTIDNFEGQKTLNLIDISIDRNAYGRQIDSFEASISINGLKKDLNAVFIRAPIIRRVGKGVLLLAKHNGEPVLLKKGNVLVGTFHPELSDDTRVHEIFLEMVKSN
jgi:5'-phosphate synthase pdxT subunit